jgi:hypothetical protein
MTHSTHSSKDRRGENPDRKTYLAHLFSVIFAGKNRRFSKRQPRESHDNSRQQQTSFQSTTVSLQILICTSLSKHSTHHAGRHLFYRGKEILHTCMVQMGMETGLDWKRILPPWSFCLTQSSTSSSCFAVCQDGTF